MSLSNQKCEIQTTLINLPSIEYIREFHYYPFKVKLDNCVGSCNTLNDLCNKVCVPNKTEDLNLHESKTLTKHISCEYKCKLMKVNIIQINDGRMRNVDVSVKKTIYVKRIIFGILVYVFVMENI